MWIVGVWPVGGGGAVWIVGVWPVGGGSEESTRYLGREEPVSPRPAFLAG